MNNDQTPATARGREKGEKKYGKMEKAQGRWKRRDMDRQTLVFVFVQAVKISEI